MKSRRGVLLALLIAIGGGTLILTLSIVIIEVALIVSLMLAETEPNMQLPRDTVFAAVMIIITGMVGLCLLTGGVRHGENTFGELGVSSALVTLAALSFLISSQ